MAIIGFVFLICVSLVGMAWGIFPGGMILVALLGVYGVIAEIEKGRLVANQANSAKTEFLANMSHEIRTPMNAVIAMSDLLVDTELSTRQREYAATIQKSARALLALLNDILDFSRLEVGKLELETIDFDLRDLVEETIEMFGHQADAKDVELSFSLHPDVPTALRGDPVRLRQVLMNLVGNAVKFTEEGEVSVDVRLGSRGAERSELRVSVADTGIGIPKNQIPHLFESFRQADASTTRRFGGTGLGLAIVHQLVDLMGGAVGVESKEGRGSTFSFTFLAEERPREPELDRVPAALPRASLSARARAESRILVVEDNVVNQTVALRMLERAGYRAEVVDNGLQALEILEERRFDLVLMDCQMPEMDGYQATARIRERERETGGRIPIVAMTANATHQDRERCLDAGMDGYVSKPVDFRELCGVVDGWLRRVRIARTA